jgi:transcriptional regulator with PAS, ATPase and Fis domain
MKKLRYKLGVIASSIPLINHVRDIAANLDDEIMISSRGLDEAVQVGKDMEKAGVEVIVSRGGTSYMLRENLQIPVLSIPTSSFDILMSIKKAAGLGKNILLTAYRDRVSEIEIFEELFVIKLLQGIYHDADSLESVIISAQDQGCEVVIGGGVSMKISKKYGLHCVELQTARETIASIIEDAKSVAKSRREEQAISQRYQCIIDSASECIIAVDQYGSITTVNQAGRNLLRIPNGNVIGKPISDYIPKSQILYVLKTGKASINKLEKVGKDLFVGSHIPILINKEIVGGVSTLKDISNVVKAENEVRRSITKGLIAKYSIEDFLHTSQKMKDVINKAKKFAESDSNILITGETGTGKEILAHSIHRLGSRRKGPFVSINCASLPDQLLESELFGHEEGAFTGAKKGGKSGLFELAHKGTIFLDEIGATPFSVQTRLLRVLQEKEVMRIGGDRLLPIDVRVIAATNKDLSEEVRAGKIREDLFFRLNVLNIHIAPLRDRIEDIPLLAGHLVIKISRKYGQQPFNIPEPFFEKLTKYLWPGNIRQLENFIEKLVLLSPSKFDAGVFTELYLQLVEYLPQTEREQRVFWPPSLKEYMGMKTRENEAKIIWKTLEDMNYCKSKAAKKLGISRTTLWRKLKEAESESQPMIDH